MGNTPISGKSIAIIGGGPGGLTLARLLQQKGATVKVYERDKDEHARVQGATLDLHEESGLAALREAGLMDGFMAAYRPGADLMRITDHNANIVHDQHEEEQPEEASGPWWRPEIDRGPLRKLLLDSLQPGTVMWDSNIMTMERKGSGWHITFRNGATANADIVIGADGANSRIRPFLTGIKPFYSGVTIIEGNVYNAATTVPQLSGLTKGGKVFALGNEQTIVLSAKGEGSLSFYAGFKVPETWIKDSGVDFNDSKQVLEWFRKEFSDWDSVWQTLFDNDQVTLVPRTLYCMPTDQYWEAQPYITMLGDAAHLMPPYAGEGVNMAMLDALELSKHLNDTQYTTAKDAIAAYEKSMRKRAGETAQGSLDNTLLFHSPGALGALTNMFSEAGQSEGD